jgi:hypothetical protein
LIDIIIKFVNFRDIQRKIRLHPGLSACFVNAPAEYIQLMSSLPFDIIPDGSKSGKYDFIQVFGSNKTELAQLVRKTFTIGKYDCLFWICYPKGSGKIKSDINRNAVWEIAIQVGMKCVSQVAIDETWSALRCRPAEMVGK